MPRIWLARLTAFLIVLGTPLHAALDPQTLPETLKPWVNWVLHDTPTARCTPFWQAQQPARCAWPGPLQVSVGTSGGRFTQTWQTEAETWIPLPGSAERWPQTVTLDKQPATVVSRAGRPMLRMPAGQSQITGEWLWSTPPEALEIPAEVGLIALEVNGTAVARPYLDGAGRLWLRAVDADATSGAESPLELKVHRKLIDDIPLRLETRIALRAAGTARELRLPNPLPADAVALALESPLPARLNADGSLSLQLRPGEWTITLVTRFPTPPTQLTASRADTPWPGFEIWSYEAVPQLRLAELDGAAAVDPAGAGVPDDWRALPAYRLDPDTVLTLKTRQRGLGARFAAQIELRRELWLDFNGAGYSLRDHLSGTLGADDWRLSALPPLELGRAALHGVALAPTQAAAEPGVGFELRGDPLDLIADGRLRGDGARLPVSGWQARLQAVTTELHLPPGWTLLHVTGTDNLPNTWLTRWSLLDLFLVLLTALAIGRFWSWPWALAALVGLALVWHEPGAPRWTWINLIAATALLTLLPGGQLRRWSGWYRTLSWAALLVIAVPFFVQQARLALHPQLEAPIAAERLDPLDHLAHRAESLAMAPAFDAAAVAVAPRTKALPSRSELPSAPLSYDPDRVIPTGPGMPRWRTEPIQLRWQGPIAAEQTFQLWLLPPLGNSLLRGLSIALLAWLALRLLRVRLVKPLALQRLPAGATALLLVFLALPPPVGATSYPPPELLQTLRDRLLTPPECAPECLTLAQLLIEANASTIALHLEFHAAAATAAPLPVRAPGWPGLTLQLDGKPATALATSATGPLWTTVPAGRHVVTLQAPAATLTRLELPLGMPAQSIASKLSGWQLHGVHEGRATEAALLLSRAAETADTPRANDNALPAFFEIHRHLSLDRDWSVTTEVRRATAAGPAVRLKVPLLPGETVLSADLIAADGAVEITVEDQVTWRSSLTRAEQLSLTAAPTSDWSETWQVEPGIWWHLEFSDLAPVEARAPLLIWRPWPGETLNLRLTRPEPVPGATLAVEQSRLTLTPGNHSTQASLDLTLRSAQGGRHRIALPANAELERVTHNDRPLALDADAGMVTLPLQVGEQSFSLVWREPHGLASEFGARAVELDAAAVNSHVRYQLPPTRWILWTWGPRQGPAVMFWALLLVLLGVAIALARIPLTPLRTTAWFLLLLGLSQLPSYTGLIVVAWLLALGGRARSSPERSGWSFNLMQIGLAALTVAAIGTLFLAVHQGLLGDPEMHVAGNFSSPTQLNWYQDRSHGTLATPVVWSVSVWWYRLLMLAWALWLAFALLRWLRWGWECYSTHQLWRPWRDRAPPVATPPTANPSPPAPSPGDNPA
ncbi:MAG: hypothetical protein ACFCUG_13420 [Thiotrichales bacterium]